MIMGLLLVWLSAATVSAVGSVPPAAPPSQAPAVAPVQEGGALARGSISQWPSPLHSKGNRILNARAEVVRPKGLMIADPAKVAGQGRFTRALFESMRATGANVIRIPVHPQHWTNDPDYLSRYLEPAVRWSGDLGMYVILDWHSIGNVLSGYAPQVPELFCHTDAMTTDFWERVAAHFKDAPHVIFEIFNEPQNISAADWRRCANRLVKLIRSRQAVQLIIVGGLEYGRELDWVLREPVTGENVAYASHIFPSHPQSGWDRDFGNVAARYPVVITEWGFIDKKQKANPSDTYLCGDARTYGQPLMSYLAQRGVGWVACWFDDEWQPAMLLPGGHGHTPWGEFATLELKRTQ